MLSVKFQDALDKTLARFINRVGILAEFLPIPFACVLVVVAAVEEDLAVFSIITLVRYHEHAAWQLGNLRWRAVDPGLAGLSKTSPPHFISWSPTHRPDKAQTPWGSRRDTTNAPPRGSNSIPSSPSRTRFTHTSLAGAMTILTSLLLGSISSRQCVNFTNF